MKGNGGTLNTSLYLDKYIAEILYGKGTEYRTRDTQPLPRAQGTSNATIPYYPRCNV
jgi:hypothetical protein